MNVAREHQLLMTRRQLFGRMSAGIGSAALASMLTPSLFGNTPADATTALTHGVIGKMLHYAPKAKRVIYLVMSGGPSQIDLFDYKPNLQGLNGTELPAKTRGDQRVTGMTAGQKSFPVAAPIFKFAQHGKSGAWVSELL